MNNLTEPYCGQEFARQKAGVTGRRFLPAVAFLVAGGRLIRDVTISPPIAKGAESERSDERKELRLAVVFFGGVSLAIYQHGINHEILNLVRASKICHRDKSYEGDEKSASAASGFHDYYPDEPESSTGDVYLEFLETLGRDVDLRVIVDVIAGASAGASTAWPWPRRWPMT
ncbi:hypothetical protein LP415_11725 [Polaromonas sp. P1(28)-8]|nr:hypothetical protein LP415_11725 [Polaromonas sp. P1(28)-8]